MDGVGTVVLFTVDGQDDFGWVRCGVGVAGGDERGLLFFGREGKNA